jgi:hypothetical protein
MLTGWFGDSPDNGYRRLYTDADLSNYIDIPEDAVLYTEPVRDAQPTGCVLVWIKRDAAVKQGGSAASRAARFLQGQVQQDFASGAAGSLDKAGLRCVTEAPCGEVTGFTGQCTKQPDVGGAWPCITAIPHCFEVTGFTGKCTHAPWPNPTRYIGCTYLHCPTNDLTHVPHICNIVATGQPGCAVVNPPQGGDPAKKTASADAEAQAVPATAMPGCGYTKTWGVCETHLLGCGPNAQAANPQAAYITSICGVTDFCKVSQNQNCGGAAAETWTNFCTMAHPPVCYPTEGCHTKFPQCHGGGAAFAAAAPAITGAVPCASVGGVCTNVLGCTVTPTSPEFKCTQSGPACPTQEGPHCPTKPVTVCTQSGPSCPTSCGPDCQSQQPGCTSIGQVCGHKPCPTNTFGFECTQACPTIPAMGCPVTNPQVCANPAQAFAAGPHTIQHGCMSPTLFGNCTYVGPQCPTGHHGCVTGWVCRTGNDSTDFCPTSLGCGGAAQAVGGVHPTIWTQIGPHCQTHFSTHCTNIGCPNTKQFECTFACTLGAPGCPQPAARAFDQSTEFCPTSGGCGGVVHPQAAIGGGFTPLQPTPATHCFVCPPFDFAAQAQARPIGTAFIQCFNHPTPATRCFICDPARYRQITVIACPVPTTQCTAGHVNCCQL